jgi:pyruvate dehydrogenase E2 component (dihydrolipoamide acetyltransferase)
MSVSVSMPQLGESVTEGTVTRWLKKEGERVERDEPLLEISTDKVDTEIPSPAAGILRGIAVAEDETVAVGAELAQIDEDAGAGQPGAAPAQAAPAQAAPAADGPDSGPGAPGGPGGPAGPAQAPAVQAAAAQAAAAPSASAPPPAASAPAPPAPAPSAPAPGAAAQAAPAAPTPAPQPPAQVPPPVSQFQGPPVSAPYQSPAPPAAPYQETPATPPPPPGLAAQPAAQAPPSGPASAPVADGQAADTAAPLLPSGPDGPYVTPLVRKLAAEHGVDLAQVSGTGVGGRIRKQDVLDAARARRDVVTAQAQQAPAAAPAPAVPGVPAAQPGAAATRPDVVPSTLRGTTEHISRLRQVIAQRMVESLQTSAQLTTVIEADVTEIARLRQRAKAEFEAREGVRLSFLPFFALAAVEALKVHPKLNAVLDTQTAQVTYHDAEHLGVAVDTERGLLVPVIRKAGDLNIGGLARKIADLAQRTRDGHVSPDELAGGTFTLTNTGSRGALFDTPIINQPQVAILGTGTVVKRPVVVEDPTLGEVIAVRSVVYLALTYDHRLIDGADAARFLATVKNRLEEGAFEAELGL